MVVDALPLDSELLPLALAAVGGGGLIAILVAYALFDEEESTAEESAGATVSEAGRSGAETSSREATGGRREVVGSGEAAGGKREVVSSGEAMGVIVEGRPGAVYGPGEHEVVPRRRDGERYDGQNWSTERFPTGITTLFWTEETDGTRTEATVIVDVHDPEAVWHRTTDLGRPLAGALERIADEVTGGAVSFTEMTPPEINARIGADAGLRIRGMAIRRSLTTSYAFETDDGRTASVEMAISGTLADADEIQSRTDDTLVEEIETAIQAVIDGRESFDEIGPDRFEEYVDAGTVRIEDVNLTRGGS